jgi:hypothetical protein
MIHSRRRPHELSARWGAHALMVLLLAACQIVPALAQINAQARSGGTPAWDKGILPISQESYYNAIECGKQGGEDPPCVFFDTGLCQNDDFTLALYTPYKMVAYEVWRTVRQKKPPPTPSYQTAQQTRITIGVTPVRGSKNLITNLVLSRGGRVVMPVDRSIDDNGGGRFTFDYPAFAAGAPGNVTLDLVGRAKTVSCLIDRSVLAQFR